VHFAIRDYLPQLIATILLRAGWEAEHIRPGGWDIACFAVARFDSSLASRSASPPRIANKQSSTMLGNADQVKPMSANIDAGLTFFVHSFVSFLNSHHFLSGHFFRA